MSKCDCCKTNEVNDTGYFCSKCWDYLMPKKGIEGIGWGNIWALLCHWHATHDESDKDYDFVHKIILLCYEEEGRT